MGMKTDIPQDYIRTELGIIPNDWQIKEFQDVMTGFFSGATPYRGRTEYYKGNIKWITSGELNYNIITDTIEKITEEAVKNTNLKILPKGTFLFAITGLEAEGTRGSCGITGVEATTNQSCMALFPKDTLDNGYLYHFYVWQGKMLALRYCQGTKQQSYTGKIARTLPIILPPTKSEQLAIATALSDADIHIEIFEKLIAKKRNIKQGVMQQLLSGKNRLAGFKDTWDLTKLGAIGTCFSGGTPSTFNSKYWNGNIIWLPSGRIQNNRIYILGSETTITQLGLDESAAKIIKPYSVLIAITGATCGNIGLLTFEASANQSVIAIEPNDKNDAIFLFYLLLQSRKRILSLQTGSAQGGVNLNSIRKLELCLPALKEQVAIGKIISEMDVEIEELEKKLCKYQRIKQGMMQVLLTGKIRPI
jgi:type I restriction enzyme, S subunit